jgi:hypothetical protein
MGQDIEDPTELLVDVLSGFQSVGSYSSFPNAGDLIEACSNIVGIYASIGKFLIGIDIQQKQAHPVFEDLDVDTTPYECNTAWYS